MQNKLINLLLVGTALALGSCENLKSYPPQPDIEFKDYKVEQLVDADNQVSYKVYLRFTLTDGDGNLGLQPGDTTGIYAPDQPYYYNLFVSMFERQADGFVPEQTKAPRHWRIPYIEPQGQNKTLIADFEIAYEFFDLLTGQYDTIRFDLHVADRDLNHSDTIRSPKIPFREPTNGYTTNNF